MAYMTHLPEIWDIIQKHVPRGKLVSLEDIYQTVERQADLDAEDFEPQSPTSDIPKWKRNTRNVLQYRKRKRQIRWPERALYELP